MRENPALVRVAQLLKLRKGQARMPVPPNHNMLIKINDIENYYGGTDIPACPLFDLPLIRVCAIIHDDNSCATFTLAGDG